MNRLILATLCSLALLSCQKHDDATVDYAEPAVGFKVARLDASWSTGTKKVLDIRMQFPDLPLAATQQQDADQLNILAQHYANNSYGKTTIVPTVTAKTYTMPQKSGYYANSRDRVVADATAAVKPDYGDVLTVFDRVIFHFPKIPMSNPGYADIGGKRIWMDGQFGAGLVAHEMGHTYGLKHAHRWQTSGDPTANSGTTLQYGDGFDIMGPQLLNADFSAAYKNRLYWLPDNRVQTVTASNTYRITRSDTNQATGICALRFRKDSGRETWVSYRQTPIPTNGAYVQWVTTGPKPESWLVDWKPTTDWKDAIVPIGSTLNDNGANLSITPIGAGGTAPNEYLDVQVTLK